MHYNLYSMWPNLKQFLHIMQQEVRAENINEINHMVNEKSEIEYHKSSGSSTAPLPYLQR